MNFEQLSSAWAGQSPAKFQLPDPIAFQRSLARELNRRRRMLAYEAGALGFGLVVFPLLSLTNYRDAPAGGTGLFWANVGLHVFISATCLTWCVRRIQRHRQLSRQRATTLRQQTEVALAAVTAEMSEYRWSPLIFALWVGLSVVSICANQPIHGVSIFAPGWRIAATIGCHAIIGFVLWRHYRVNLKPDQARQQELLRQLV